MKRKWIKASCNKNAKDVVSKILSARNIVDINKFFSSDLSDLNDMSLLEDVEIAIKILKESIENKIKIVIHTDYDVDGMCAGAIGYLMLKELGADVSYYTNNRFVQGYGIKNSSVDEIIKLYPDVKLVITMDNGIVAYEAANYLNKLGIKMIITDHHEPQEKLPQASAIINPKRTKKYPFREMCGAGVVWKLFSQLYKNKYSDTIKYLDLVALATVGDVVPLIDENRIMVKKGIRMIELGTRPIFKKLNEMMNTVEVTAHYTLAFVYVPILNSIGRLGGNATDIIDIMVSEDEKYINEVLFKIITLNESRKELTTTQVDLAISLLKKINDEAIVLYDERFHEGIVGLIAGRLKEYYNRPAFIFAKGANGVLKGSGRSIDGFDMKKALDDCSDLLESYGGHYMAAGLSLKEENLFGFKKRINDVFKIKVSKDDLIKKYYYIDELNEEKITEDLVKKIKALEPYGAGFEKPLFKIKNIPFKEKYIMGKNKEHIKFINNGLTIIAWRQTDNYQKRGSPKNITALGFPEINTYNDIKNIQFAIEEDNFY